MDCGFVASRPGTNTSVISRTRTSLEMYKKPRRGRSKYLATCIAPTKEWRVGYVLGNLAFRRNTKMHFLNFSILYRKGRALSKQVTNYGSQTSFTC